MRRINTRVVPPTADAVPLEQLKDALRITSTDQDDYLQSIIRDATSWIEEYTGRSLMLQTWELAIDLDYTGGLSQGAYIDLDHGPLYVTSPIVSIKYYDMADVEYTMSATNYWADVNGRRIVFSAAFSWPVSLRPLRSIVVQYLAGYSSTNAEKVPGPIRRAILMLAAYWYTNPEAILVGSISKELEFGVRDCCSQYNLNLKF